MNTPLTRRQDGNAASAEAVPPVPAAAGAAEGTGCRPPGAASTPRQPPRSAC